MLPKDPEAALLYKEKLRGAAINQFSDPTQRENVGKRKRGKTAIELYGEKKAKELSEIARKNVYKAFLNPVVMLRRKTNAPTLMYAAWSVGVKKRDKYTCQRCKKENLKGSKCHAHHIKPQQFYPELMYEIGNGQTLCSNCHRVVEGIFIKKSMAALKEIRDNVFRTTPEEFFQLVKNLLNEKELM